MKALAFLRTKLNSFSIIGSLVYGLFCASFPTPEVVAVIGHIAYFLSAALFYFSMYVLYSENKELVSRLWKNKIRNSGIFIFGLTIVCVPANCIIMVVNHISYDAAADILANYLGNFFYYIPFLP